MCKIETDPSAMLISDLIYLATILFRLILLNQTAPTMNLALEVLSSNQVVRNLTHRSHMIPPARHR